ncbi:MAG: A/G-specific adenine glycosylase, partial [Acidobacteria bacterium]|nr:A/G-specific adenine glycosylase [Acidobacteriota bacterium]HQF97959.1 A/G-specific adenine glycosylase [Candidatus Aminicenantes bacterium]
MIRRRRAIRRSDLPAESNGRCDEGWDALFPGRLLRWYAARKRDLPWRRTRDPYRVWVSEIMLQQTTVGAVIPYYNAWLRAFPDLQTLARAPLQKVLKAWEGLGYYQRARNMRRTARIIRDRCGGRFPEDPADLAALPGFGPYTAAAVASLAFHRPVPVVEANVRRVMTRMLGLAGPPGAGRDAAIARFLEKRISRRSPGNFNQAMMEWGALVCRPKNPLCLKCPGQNFCRAFARGEQDVLPAPKTLRPKDITAVVAVIRKNGRVLLQKRPETGLLAGLWEFPGGKVEAGETLRAALRRELREERGFAVESARPLMT